MKFINNGFEILFAIAMSQVFSACQPMKKKDFGPARSVSEQFGATAKVCSTSVAMREIGAPGSDGLRPAAVEVQLEICGHIKNYPDKGWKAIGASAQADSVRLAGKYANAVGSSESKLFVDDQGNLIAQTSGGPQKIGKFQKVQRGARLEPASAQTFQIMVESEPFSLDKHSKDSKGMNVWVR